MRWPTAATSPTSQVRIRPRAKTRAGTWPPPIAINSSWGLPRPVASLGRTVQRQCAHRRRAPGAHLLVTHRGQTLAEVVHDMNKFSNNVMARQLFLTLGLAADNNRTPASLTRSRDVLNRWLDKNDLAMPGLVVENGSGLSRIERISATELASLLQHGINSPTAQVLIESMPTVGVDGTMRNRLMNRDVAGNAHIKTGTLDDVGAVAGYVGSRSGNIYVVVSLVNDPRASQARGFNDALISWVYENAP
nr:D-alanyl-D-alanine carboxypeptidase [Pandoraea sp. XY-2]